MTRKKIYKGVLTCLLITIVAVNLSFGNSMKSFFRPKLARAAYDIECNCAAFGGNLFCAVNNYGSSCAPAGTTFCANYNRNCGSE